MKTIQIDTSKSVINWKAYKTGGSHIGTVKIWQGSIDLDDDGIPVGGSITFDMNTISDTDQPAPLKASLEQHLKSDQFFDIEKFPTSQFIVEKVDHTADSDGYYAVSGFMSLKGIKNEILFKIKFVTIDKEIKIESNTIHLDRTRWGISYGSKNIFKKLADHVVADVFDVTGEIYAAI